MYKTSNYTFKDLVALSGWDETKGPYPGVFRDKAAGHRCVWSIKWSCDNGILEPSQAEPPDLEGLRYEVKDVWERFGHPQARDLLSRDASEQEIRAFLNEARAHYGDYHVCPFTPQGSYVRAILTRTGWPRPQDMAPL